MVHWVTVLYYAHLGGSESDDPSETEKDDYKDENDVANAKR